MMAPQTLLAEPESNPTPDTDFGQRWRGRHIHFVGIGGCGMSGLALLLARHGAVCSGSDMVESSVLDVLREAEINITLDQTGDAISQDCELVVASAAIDATNAELLAAEARRGIETISYAEMLGRVQSEHLGVSIAGTHGKSTTTAMLCHVLIHCALDPSFIIGAVCDQIGGGSRVGSATIPDLSPLAGRPGLLLAEACEFNRSFHHHRPVMGLINNIEEDHLDIYQSLDDLVDAFAQFAQLLPPASENGWLLIAHEGAHRRTVTAGLHCDVQTFGFSPAADYLVAYDAHSARVGVMIDDSCVATWTNRMAGEHNALNAAAAAIIAHRLGAKWSDIAEALGSFAGLERRMQRLGTRTIGGGEVTIYDDYGHHPTEIEKTLQALRASENPQRLICVFQPHQHSRTRFLLEEFAQSFSNADVVIVPQIYFVRDSEIEKHRVSAGDLVDRLRTRGIAAMHLYPFEAIAEQLEIICRPGDLVVIMGAGPVWRIGRRFLRTKVDEYRLSTPL